MKKIKEDLKEANWKSDHCNHPRFYLKNDNFHYEFIEIREEIDGVYSVCDGYVDLTEYEVKNLAELCLPYYDSLEEIVREYGFEGALFVIAECIFDQYLSCEMNFVKEFDKFIEAEMFMNAYIAWSCS